MNRIFTTLMTVTVCFSSITAMAQSKLSYAITTMLQSVEEQRAEKNSSQLVSKGAAVCPVDTASIQKRMEVHFNADGTVKSLGIIAQLADGAECPEAQLESAGIRVTGRAFNFVFLQVPAEKLPLLEGIDAFVSLSENGISYPDNTHSRKLTGVSDINGLDGSKPSDLPYGFTGRDVIVGVIDCGIEFNHPAFLNPDGSTRIVKAVDYRTGEKVVRTDPSEIAEMTSDCDGIETNNDALSHGTHVSGIAAGSPVESFEQETGNDGNQRSYVRNHMGMAPEADLVLCGLGEALYDNRILESINEIKMTADLLNKPYVINMSFGNDDGRRNGNTSYGRAISAIANPGFIACVATGNGALYDYTVDKTLNTGEKLRIILNRDAENVIPKGTVSFYFDTKKSNPVTYQYWAVDVNNGVVTSLTQNPLLGEHGGTVSEPAITFGPDAANGGYINGTLTLSGARKFADDAKYLMVELTATMPVRVYAVGQSHSFSSFYSKDVPSLDYDKGSADMSMSTVCGNSEVITVGAYNNTRGFYSYSRNTLLGYNADMVGEPNGMAKFSAYGIADNGRLCPDVAAPGVAIISSVNSYDTDLFSSTDGTSFNTSGTLYATCSSYTPLGDRKFWYGADNGTSMACPMVSGIMALWLQADPLLTPELAREVIDATSRKVIDDKEIAVPSGNALQLGAGLIDAAAGLRYILNGYESTDVKAVVDKSERSSAPKKYITPDGTLVIEHNGKRYSVVGM